MDLCQAIRLCSDPHPGSLALVGSGGKTTALFQLARSLHRPNPHSLSGSEQSPVVVAATSHLKVDQIQLADSHWLGESPADFNGLQNDFHGIMLFTGPVAGDRTTGLDSRSIQWLHDVCQQKSIPLLIEADGSRQRPLKAPTVHEPPIPKFVDTVLVVAGLSALGKPLDQENVHRPEIFSRLSGLALGVPITSRAIVCVLCHPDGGLKNIPVPARRLVFVNQADSAQEQSTAGKMASTLLEQYEAVIVGSLQQGVLQTIEHTAGIILAAGEARRFGRSKQLLEYHGQTFLRTVALTALASGLHPVVVVTGANASAVENVIQDLPIILIRNPDWQTGQSSSVRTGLKGLASTHPLRNQNHLPNSSLQSTIGREWGSVGSALFLLADQPQVPVSLLRALVEHHSLDLAPILAPLVNDRRANPVLFDRQTFPDLLALTGDVGGRAIFSKYTPTYLPWHDESLLLDVDTPEDLKKLRDLDA